MQDSLSFRLLHHAEAYFCHLKDGRPHLVLSLFETVSSAPDHSRQSLLDLQQTLYRSEQLNSISYLGTSALGFRKYAEGIFLQQKL